MPHKVTNIVVAGLGGQGVITCSDILADAAMLAGYDVKKAEVHGMSQRGGSVTCDVRFGSKIFSPLVSPGEAQFLLVLSEDQLASSRHYLGEAGRVLMPEASWQQTLSNRRSLNIALLGQLSLYLDIDDDCWLSALRTALKPELYQQNVVAFQLGKNSAKME